MGFSWLFEFIYLLSACDYKSMRYESLVVLLLVFTLSSSSFTNTTSFWEQFFVDSMDFQGYAGTSLNI